MLGSPTTRVSLLRSLEKGNVPTLMQHSIGEGCSSGKCLHGILSVAPGAHAPCWSGSQGLRSWATVVLEEHLI